MRLILTWGQAVDKHERIYVRPKRGRLPRKYEFIDQPNYHPWWIAAACICVGFLAYKLWS